MKISKVTMQLTGEDITSIINDFVKVDGLELKEVIIDKNIILEGTFTKVISINFRGEIEVIGTENGKLICRIASFKVLKLGLFRMIRSLALKLALKELQGMGITSEKDKVIVDINKILSNVPYVRLNLQDATIKGQALILDVEEINISLLGQFIKEEEDEVLEGDVIEQELNITLPSEKVNDGYLKGRSYVETKLPDKAKKYSDYILMVPDIAALIYRLLKDSRVPTSTKVIISAAIGYVTFPTDIIPNNIPFIGKVDDIAVVFFALNRIVNDVPLQIILENYAGKDELLLLLTNGLDYITNFTGAKNVEKLYSVISEIRTL